MKIRNRFFSVLFVIVFLLGATVEAQVPWATVSGQVLEEGTRIPQAGYHVVFHYAHPETALTDIYGRFGNVVSSVGDNQLPAQAHMRFNPITGRTAYLLVPTTDKSAEVDTRLYDLRGRELDLDAAPAPSGVYLVQVRIGDRMQTTRFTVIDGLESLVTEIVNPLADGRPVDKFLTRVTVEFPLSVISADTSLDIRPGLNDVTLLTRPAPTGDSIDLQLVNNETGFGEKGEVKVYNKGTGVLLSVFQSDAFGRITHTFSADFDSFDIRARTFHVNGDTSYVRKKTLYSPGFAELLDDTLRVVPTDNLRNLPPDPMFPGDPPTTNFFWLAANMTTRGAPSGTHIHPWLNGTYVTDTGNMVLALDDTSQGSWLTQPEIAFAETLVVGIWQTYGYQNARGPLDIRRFANSVSSDTVAWTPRNGYTTIRAKNSLPGVSAVTTWSNVDAPYQMVGADISLNVGMGPVFERAVRIGFAQCLGVRDPPTWSEPWASGVSWFSQTTSLSDFSVADTKILMMLAHFVPTDLMYILGFPDQWGWTAADYAQAREMQANIPRDGMRRYH